MSDFFLPEPSPLAWAIGLAWVKARIGIKNLAYNMRRLVQLGRLAASPE